MSNMEWLQSLISAGKALKITPEMSPSDVHLTGVRGGSFLSILIDSYPEHADFSAGDFYIYYDIGMMSGSAGFIIMKDDIVVKHIVIIMS